MDMVTKSLCIFKNYLEQAAGRGSNPDQWAYYSGAWEVESAGCPGFEWEGFRNIYIDMSKEPDSVSGFNKLNILFHSVYICLGFFLFFGFFLINCQDSFT